MFNFCLKQNVYFHSSIGNLITGFHELKKKKFKDQLFESVVSIFV